MKKYLILLSGMIFVVFLCLGFVYKENDSKSNDDIYTITYGVDEIPKNLKTITNLTDRDMDIMCALSKGLVYKDDNNNIKPELCSDFSVTNDKIQYEFNIRDDIYWSDKSKITTDDMVTFFKELLKEEDSENIGALLNVYGAKEYRNNQTTFMEGVAIKAYDNKLIIRLNAPDDNFLNELTKPQYRLRRNIIMWEDIYRNYNKLVYSGDYKLESISKSNILLKSNNENKTIDIIKDENNEMSMAAFEIKERDMVLNPPESEIAKFSKDKKILTIPDKKSTYVYINSRNGEVSIERRRNIYKNVYEALSSQCTDYTKEYELAECSYFRENKSDLSVIQTRKVSMNKALNDKLPEVLTIIAQNTQDNRSLCKKIQEWFAKNTKTNIKLSFVKDEMNDAELKSRYDMVIINAESSIDNKKKLYSFFKDYMSEAEYKLLNNNNEQDYRILEESLFNNYDVLPLVFYNENIVYSDDISTIKNDKNGNIDFSSIK